MSSSTAKNKSGWIHDRVLADSMKNPPWSDDEQMKELLGGCEECSGKGGDLFGKRIADACTKTEVMPTDACRIFYECSGCGAKMRPKPGDCCVFCSYGSVSCPPIQAERSGGAGCCG